MDSKLAAARLDFMELLAGDGAVFSRLLQEAKVEQGERERSPSHLPTCAMKTGVDGE